MLHFALVFKAVTTGYTDVIKGVMTATGIYFIKNKVNGKIYVGSSINFAKRWWEHKKWLRLGDHANDHLQGSWNLYGESAFEFLVEKVLPDNISDQDLKAEEQVYINKLWDGGDKCYNISKRADRPNAEESKVPINQLCKQTGRLVKAWNGIVDAAMALGVDPTGIMNCCRGRLGSAGGFIWVYADPELSSLFSQHSTRHGGHGKRLVEKLDPRQGNKVVEEYASLKEAAEKNGIKSYVSVLSVCRGNRQTTSGGLVFRYKQNHGSCVEGVIKSDNSSSIECLVCGLATGLKNRRSLASHLQTVHKLRSEDYTVQYLTKGVPGCGASSCLNLVRYVSFEFKRFCKEHSFLGESLGGKVGGSQPKKRKKEIPQNDQPYSSDPDMMIDYLDLSLVTAHEDRTVRSKSKQKALLDKKNYMLIFSDEWRNKPDLVRSMILNRAQCTLTKHDARKLVVGRVETDAEKHFFKEHHISGYVPSRVCFGLTSPDGVLLCALSLRLPVQKKKHANTIEIARLATKQNCIVRGGFTKLLKLVFGWCQQNNITSIMSYAELRFGEGKVYKNNGFHLITANTGENYWYTDGTKRFFRSKFRAQVNKTENQVALENKVWRVYGCGNALYKQAVPVVLRMSHS